MHVRRTAYFVIILTQDIVVTVFLQPIQRDEDLTFHACMYVNNGPFGVVRGC